jgi:hypothetical protein
MPHHVHHAELHLCLRVDGLYRFGEALEAVHAGDEDVRDSAALQLRHDLHPELRPLRVSRPHPQDFLEPLHVDAG